MHDQYTRDQLAEYQVRAQFRRGGDVRPINVTASSPERAITQAANQGCWQGKVMCDVYDGHEGYYMPDERIVRQLVSCDASTSADPVMLGVRW